MTPKTVQIRSRLTYLTYMALLITFAVVIHTVEAALPVPMPVPGVRLGLANIITLLTLIIFGIRSALLVAVMRSFLGSLFFGGLFSFGFWLSLGGGVISTLVMALVLIAYNRGYVGLVSVSVIGAAAHNFTQLALASLIIGTFTLLQGYFPLLLLLSVPTGFFTGLAVHYLSGVTARIVGQVGEGGN